MVSLPLAQEVGADALTEKAREHGLAALAITRVFHVAALWPEVETLAERGLVAFAFTGLDSFCCPRRWYQTAVWNQPDGIRLA